MKGMKPGPGSVNHAEIHWNGAPQIATEQAIQNRWTKICCVFMDSRFISPDGHGSSRATCARDGSGLRVSSIPEALSFP